MLKAGDIIQWQHWQGTGPGGYWYPGRIVGFWFEDAQHCLLALPPRHKWPKRLVQVHLVEHGFADFPSKSFWWFGSLDEEKIIRDDYVIRKMS